MKHGEGPRIIIALDFATEKEVLSLTEKLDPQRCRVKVGKELFTRCGPKLVENLVKQKFDVFLDLKYHDIPNTVARACVAAADLGIWMLNVHALGGRKMMEAARKALDNIDSAPLLIAVTVLTSLEDMDLNELGISSNTSDMVIRLANLAFQTRMDGVVCSPLEAKLLREKFGANFCLVTPGVRPKMAAAGGQKRVTSPADAIQNGSNYLVIGRPITGADDPVKALMLIEADL
jgi:orotidine-5'-phosphate decarboxylase